LNSATDVLRFESDALPLRDKPANIPDRRERNARN
jgi:hypothetical protein